MELTIDVVGAALPATLDAPIGRAVGGVVVLHGAQAGHRSYFLYEHVAKILTRQGIAVLRYDRRPSDRDVPFDIQAGDAVAAIRLLRRHIGEVPIGLWGFSQGGWVAPTAAAIHPDEIAFIIAVSASGVSPAEQMRYGCDRQLAEHGYGEAARGQLRRVRLAVEEFLRGRAERTPVQRLLDEAAAQPWFGHAYLRSQLPDKPGGWTDMDFDPEPIFQAVSCPVLAFYGETDQWVPIDESIACWERAMARSAGGSLRVVRLPGCDHLPTLRRGTTMASISRDYTRALMEWVDATVTEHKPLNTV